MAKLKKGLLKKKKSYPKEDKNETQDRAKKESDK